MHPRARENRGRRFSEARHYVEDEPVPKIVHKVEYRHVSSDDIIFEEESDRFAPSKEPPSQPVLEVVTVAFTAQDRSPFQFRHEAAKPPQIHSMGPRYICINSAAVINALRAVVEYYPDQSLIGNSITIDEPYLILVHHEKELRKYRESFAPNATASENKTDEMGKCVGEEDTYEHLGIVLDFLQSTLKDSFAKERELHRRERPACTYEMLWMLFKPGTDVYFDSDSCGVLDSYVVRSVSWKINNGAPVLYEIQLWNLDYDAIYIGPRQHTAIVLPFDGEKEIASLDVFPCEYLTKEARGESYEERRKFLEERGRMFFQLTSKQCMWYDGYTTTFPKHKYTGLVMVDEESFIAKVYAERPPGTKLPAILTNDVGERTIGGIPNCNCKRCTALNNMKRKSPFADYARINPLTTKELTPHQYFLCDRSFEAFVLKVRSWQRLDVACFSKPRFDTNLVDDLVLDRDTRTLVKSLCKKYAREDPIPPDQARQSSVPGLLYKAQNFGAHPEDQWSSDSALGKGEGVIFLLHGKPGVGKTYTAECIADYTKRPLLSLTCTDIGTNPLAIESRLTYWFKLAKHWGAILLIDEADIYMEARITSHLERNNLVAGFLRAMEHYQGILFLTTNRVGTFDEAFMSRIHVAIHYPDFSDGHRADVWASFFRRLEQERGSKLVISDAVRKYVTSSAEVRAVKWNGREIRNAFQTSVALAEQEEDKDGEGRVILKESHVRNIVRMSGAFKKYLHTLHQGDEAKVAAREGLRVDDFDENEVEEMSHYI
ncbi:hypothetical protein BDY21DRAFT_293312 [Lineolata rhizophorae]|uniref:AAA+ ATPase domain-containing protein n=1 Tax=Lineolata rhizophorae TaxID=578093 RepID=A0A6A6NNN6_9PEZI|nr:hypothetical protein BDY21DRAFT_293312 [Lineolata rhizophorae]